MNAPLNQFQTVVVARIDNHKADLARKEAADRERIRAEEAARLEREATARAREEAARLERQKMLDEDAAVMRQQEQARAAAAPTTPTPSTVVQATFAAPPQAEKPALQLVPAGPPTLNLGRINERIAPLGITVSGLEKLGFPPAAQQGASKLYHESQFPAMVCAMIEHLGNCMSHRSAA